MHHKQDKLLNLHKIALNEFVHRVLFVLGRKKTSDMFLQAISNNSDTSAKAFALNEVLEA